MPLCRVCKGDGHHSGLGKTLQLKIVFNVAVISVVMTLCMTAAILKVIYVTNMEVLSLCFCFRTV